MGITENKEKGLKAEYHLISKLNQLGIPYSHDDRYYDIKADQKLIEVKSCRITRKDGKHEHPNYKIGRFDFTNEDQLTQLKENKAWICFIITHTEDQFIILGFCKAKELPNKRYHTIHDTRKYNLIPLRKWVDQQ